MSNKNVTKIERLSSGMVKLYNKSNVIGAFSALNSISIGYENNNARTIQFTDNGNTISFQLFNLQEIIGSTTSVTYTPIDTTSTGPDYNARVFEVFDFLSSEVFQGFSPGPTYVGGVVAAYPNFASFPVTGTQSVIYIDEADNSAYYWDGSSYQLLIAKNVEQYANFASFPVTGLADVIYIDMSVPEPYVWDGAAYVSLTDSATVAWGNITGTLSDQTDLQAALDDKVPYTGATGDVDLGEYELKAGQVELDQTPTGTAGVAVMRWNDTDGTADLGLKGGNVTLQLGQEMLIRAVNKSGGDLLEANYQAVRLRLVSEGGAAGQRLAVKLALADSDINSATTIGLVTETILNNQEGFITTIGNVREINTTGSLQGETWVDGDILYLSPTVAGQLTNIKPVAPDHLVVVGYVEYAHAIHGKIYVKCDNGYELDELHNVFIDTPTTWQVLRYDATAGYWTNSSLSASILPSGIDASKIGAGTVDNTEFGYLDGVTSSIQSQLDGKVPTTRTLTINGTTQDLSADRTFTIATGLTVGTTPITSGTVGRVLFEGTGNVLQESSSMSFDSSIGALTIATAMSNNTNAPLVVQNLTAYSNPFNQYIQLWKNSVGANILSLRADGSFDLAGSVNTSTVQLGTNGNGTSLLSLFRLNAGFWFPSGTMIGITTSSLERMRVTNLGNVLIGTTTDAGFKLDVNGTSRFNGTTTISSDLRTNQIYPIQNGNLLISAQWADSTQVAIEAITNKAQVLIVRPNANITLASGTHDTERITHTFAPTSGTAVVNALTLQQTINQTGGANGITRGLYINPTLTSAFDFRAIETTAGNVLFGASGTGFYWDNTNSRLGIGTASPATPLHVLGNVTIGNPASLWRINFDVTSGSNPGGYLNWTFSDNFTYYRQYNQSAFHNYETTSASSYGHRFLSQGAVSLTIRSNGNVLIGTTTDAGFKLDVNGTARVSGIFTCSNQVRGTSLAINDSTVLSESSQTLILGAASWYTLLRVVKDTIFNGTSINASAQVQIDSTTKGFLPPRMTTTEKNAIASPAAGLVVYDNTVNALNYYNGTAWSSTGLTVLQVTPVTLTAASWTLVSGLYEYTYSNAAILSTSIVDVIPLNSTIAIVQAAQVLPETLSSAGSVKLYATNLPSADIIVSINIFN